MCDGDESGSAFVLLKLRIYDTKNDSWAQNQKSWELARAYYRIA